MDGFNNFDKYNSGAAHVKPIGIMAGVTATKHYITCKRSRWLAQLAGYTTTGDGRGLFSGIVCEENGTYTYGTRPLERK